MSGGCVPHRRPAGTALRQGRAGLGPGAQRHVLASCRQLRRGKMYCCCFLVHMYFHSAHALNGTDW